MKIRAFIFLFFCASTVQAQIIPAGNRVEWHHAGCQFPFTEPQLTANVMDFGAVADGLTDDMQSVYDAIASLNGHYGIVYFPAGSYMLQSGVSLPDSVIIRGAGSDSTFIKINSTGAGFGIYGSCSGVFTTITSGFGKDSEKITVVNAALFAPGDNVEIRQDNGSWDTSPAVWAVKVVGQISKITSISGDTLFLEDKLRITFDTALNLEIQKIFPRKHVLIECLNIERTNSSTTANGYNLEFYCALNCRVSGVESNKSQGSHCMINLSSHIEVTGSYFHDAYLYDGAGTKGYGVTLNSHAGLCLISNNIFKHLRHAMMTKAGANGNVFAYNYSTDVYRNGAGEFPADYSGDISLHGHYSFANLFEGNIVQNLQIDNTWGPSGPYNTFFRNRTEHYGIVMFTTLTTHSNFVGNEIIGSFPYGAYTITGSGNFEHGNNKNGTITPAGTTVLIDSSYYFNAVPSFWDISEIWPSIGVSNTLNSGTIPAKERFVNGEYTVCNTDILTGIAENSKVFSVAVIPNPASESVAVSLFSITKTNAVIRFYSVQGQLIRCFIWDDIQTGSNIINIDISDFSKGVYLVNITSNAWRQFQKLIVN